MSEHCVFFTNTAVWLCEETHQPVVTQEDPQSKWFRDLAERSPKSLLYVPWSPRDLGVILIY